MYVMVFDENDVGVEVDTDRYKRDEHYRAQIHAALRTAGGQDDLDWEEAMEAVTEFIRALLAGELEIPEVRDAPSEAPRLQ